MKPLEMNDLANVKTLDREEMIKCTGGCKEPYEWEKKWLKERYGPFWQVVIVH